MKGNREYKSDVFSLLLENWKNALDLYNAINHSDYKDPEMVEICTLDRGVSLSIRNDAAFVLDMNLSVYEHQSTVCPNMPVRSLIYFSNILEQMIKGQNIYGHKLVKIPTPRFAVFYNGEEKQPEQYDLRLSDAYIQPVENPELELICKVYNINYGKNRELLSKCGFLKDYMTFVDYVRNYHKEYGYNELEHAIEVAIDQCIKEGVLRDFLMEHRTEVVKVTRLDYTFDRQLALEREDSRTEGRTEGLAEGRAEGLAEGLDEGRKKEKISLISKKIAKNKSLEQIADELEEDKDSILPIYNIICKMPSDVDTDEIYTEIYQ